MSAIHKYEVCDPATVLDEVLEWRTIAAFFLGARAHDMAPSDVIRAMRDHFDMPRKEPLNPSLGGVSDAERLKLTEAGYMPVLRWQRSNVVCTTGEALLNIEVEGKRKACAHTRKGPSDYCSKCGAVMPWADPPITRR